MQGHGFGFVLYETGYSVGLQVYEYEIDYKVVTIICFYLFPIFRPGVELAGPVRGCRLTRRMLQVDNKYLERDELPPRRQ